MGIFIAIVVALGFGALAFAVFKGVNALQGTLKSQTTGVNEAANRIANEGIFASLFPKGNFLTGGPDAAKNPANWGSLIKDATSAGTSIYHLIASGNSGGGSSGDASSRPPSLPIRADGTTGVNEGPPDITKYSDNEITVPID